MLKKVLVLGLLSMLVAAAGIASWNKQMAANIPFDFYLGDQLMPAGAYTITPVNANSSVVMVSSRRSLHRAVVATKPVTDSAGKFKSELVFENIGGDYFLTRFRHTDMDIERLVPPSPRQLEISRGNNKEKPVKLAVVRIR